MPYGYLPVLEEGVLESRHLGLKLPWEAPDFPKRLKKLAEKLEETVDIDGILELAEGAPKLEEKPQSGSLRIAAAKDEAFCFCYPDNLRFLEERVAVVNPFSPLHDPHFPEDVDCLLLYG